MHVVIIRVSRYKIICENAIMNLEISFQVGGGCLILLGSLIIDNAGSAQNLFHSAYVLLPSIIMLIAGLFMVALAFVGCFACLKQTKCLNYTVSLIYL